MMKLLHLLIESSLIVMQLLFKTILNSVLSKVPILAFRFYTVERIIYGIVALFSHILIAP